MKHGVSQQKYGNNTPSVLDNSNPQHGSTGISIDTTLAWLCSDPNGDDLTYSIYFGLAADPPLISSNYSDITFNPGTLDYDFTYYCKIVATDVYGDSTSSTLWSFSLAYPN